LKAHSDCQVGEVGGVPVNSGTPSVTVPALPFAGHAAGQIGVLVEDLSADLARWSALLGRDDWLVYTYGPHNMKNASYHAGRARSACGSR
jgi:glyoxylase-like metal-dependent hydrolase (beta-lactamase superfamily II)